MRIDAHQHFWLYKEETHSWISEDMKVLRRTFLPNDISYTLKKNKIDGAVLVQASQSIAENKFLKEMSDAYAMVKGIVGWIDFSAKNIADQLREYAEDPVMKGFRHIVEDEEDPDFLLRDDFMNGLELLAKYDFSYDLLIRPRHFESTLACIRQNPNLSFVLDHMGKPDIKKQEFDQWAQFITDLSQFSNVHCKISGLVTEAEWRKWKEENFRKYVDFTVKSFGKDRIMFGSDWPVCLLSAQYEEWLKICQNLTNDFSEEDKNKFWGRNATNFYKLK